MDQTQNLEKLVDNINSNPKKLFSIDQQTQIENFLDPNEPLEFSKKDLGTQKEKKHFQEFMATIFSDWKIKESSKIVEENEEQMRDEWIQDFLFDN